MAIKLHYLFGTRYAVTDENNTEDLRHRNAVFGVHDLLSKRGYDLVYHYHNENMLHSFSVQKNDIAINLHPQNPNSLDLMLEAKAVGALCGAFLDSADIPALTDPDGTLAKSLKKAHFVMAPGAMAVKLVEKYNKRVWVVPPIVENESHLPYFNLCDVKKGKRPLRVTSIVDVDQQDGFVHLLASLIQTGKSLYPLDLNIFVREPTGFNEKPDTETFKQTAAGMVRLAKNQRINVNLQNLNTTKLHHALDHTDVLLIAPSDDPLSGNVQLPLMGIHAGLLVMLPTKSKIYAPVYEYGTVPYQPNQLKTVLAGLVMDHTLHFCGKITRGQTIIKRHHTPEKLAAHYDMIFQAEMKHRNHPVQAERKDKDFWKHFEGIDKQFETGIPLSSLNQHPSVLPHAGEKRTGPEEKEDVTVRQVQVVS